MFTSHVKPKLQYTHTSIWLVLVTVLDKTERLGIKNKFTQELLLSNSFFHDKKWDTYHLTYLSAPPPAPLPRHFSSPHLYTHREQRWLLYSATASCGMRSFILLHICKSPEYYSKHAQAATLRLSKG